MTQKKHTTRATPMMLPLPSSASDESEDEVTVVPRVEIHETVPDEQTSADPFNSISMGSIEHIKQHKVVLSKIMVRTVIMI
uniref:Uncharacterized protein n=1 Tax=Chenopodium quinoa TaxID=63459 RepID=A0A803ND86_CHEQI